MLFAPIALAGILLAASSDNEEESVKALRVDKLERGMTGRLIYPTERRVFGPQQFYVQKVTAKTTFYVYGHDTDKICIKGLSTEHLAADTAVELSQIFRIIGKKTVKVKAKRTANTKSKSRRSRRTRQPQKRPTMVDPRDVPPRPRTHTLITAKYESGPEHLRVFDLPKRLNVNTITVGDFGDFGQKALAVRQIIDATNAIVGIGGRTLWLRGVPTADLADGDLLTISWLFKITGKKRYITTSGGSQTVFIAEPAGRLRLIERKSPMSKEPPSDARSNGQ